MLRIAVTTCLLVLTLVIPINAVAQQPGAMVRDVFHALLTELQTQRDAQTQTRDTVRDAFSNLLSPHIDYLSLARWILRDHWVGASPTQQETFLQAFEGYIIHTYALVLANGKKIILDVKGDPVLRKNSAIVTADFIVEDSDPVQLDFRLLHRDEKWQLFDVAFSGVSLARTFRSDFNYVAKQGGIDAVTEHLIRRSSGGTSR